MDIATLIRNKKQQEKYFTKRKEPQIIEDEDDDDEILIFKNLKLYFEPTDKTMKTVKSIAVLLGGKINNSLVSGVNYAIL